MLQTLTVKNLAVISQARVDFAPGLNVLTGETGAGKSILIDSLNLLMGGRASNDILRAGETQATIEAYFDLSGSSLTLIREILAPVGFDNLEDGELIVRRELYANGRGRFFINDRGVMGATLRRLQPFLIEIYGQGEQQALLTARSHLELLDEFGGCASLRREVAESYARWREAVEALERLEKDEAERERTAQFLRYQLAAINEVNPRPSEELELAHERRLLAQGERISSLCAEGYGALYESDESVLTRLAAARRRLQALAEVDERFAPSIELLATAQALIEEVAGELRRYQTSLDFSPARLAEVENRLAALERLRRKLGRDLSEIGALRQELEDGLSRLENLEDLKASARRQVEDAARDYIERGRKLSARRHSAASSLEKSVMRELAHLAMERAQFKVSIETVEANRKVVPSLDEEATEAESDEREGGSFWTPRGCDRVEFLLAANVGEALRPLGRVASGGELSRLMLALRTSVQPGVPRGGRGSAEKSLDSDNLFEPTMIFDEVDAGIGGRVAQAVGRRLKGLAAQRQVLCVTHQPQLARYADAHFVVTKRVFGARTVAEIERLDARGRVGELARMIGGAENVSTARAAARWMLKSANEEGAGEEARARE